MRLRLVPPRTLSPEARLAEFDAGIDAPWYREWQTAAGTAVILASRIDDEDVQAAAKNMGVRQERMLATMSDSTAYEQAVRELEDAAELANDLIGKRIQELDAVCRERDLSPWWGIDSRGGGP
jgi:hypothetical protein